MSIGKGRRGDSLGLATIEGVVCVKGRRGRRRFKWVDNIRKLALMRNTRGSLRAKAR